MKPNQHFKLPENYSKNPLIKYILLFTKMNNNLLSLSYHDTSLIDSAIIEFEGQVQELRVLVVKKLLIGSSIALNILYVVEIGLLIDFFLLKLLIM